MSKKEYTGSVYIGVVGSENENGECRDSIEAIQRRKKDTPPQYNRATKGFEARQAHLNNWYENTKHAFMLLLDGDMLFPAETLERLRRHKKPFVSGFYMRRTFTPPLPVWFENNEPGMFPLKPLTFVPERNMLYPISASGWGCMLIHRDVVKALKRYLKGEQEILEDDMDVMPYDLKRVFKALKVLDGQVALKQPHVPTLETNIRVLLQELIPFRMVKDIVGSDLRFPFFAKLAGFQLWGDTGVNCGHTVSYAMSLDDYYNQRPETIRDISLAINKENQKEADKLKKARKL